MSNVVLKYCQRCCDAHSAFSDDCSVVSLSSARERMIFLGFPTLGFANVFSLCSGFMIEFQSCERSAGGTFALRCGDLDPTSHTESDRDTLLFSPVSASRRSFEAVVMSFDDDDDDDDDIMPEISTLYGWFLYDLLLWAFGFCFFFTSQCDDHASCSCFSHAGHLRSGVVPTALHILMECAWAQWPQGASFHIDSPQPIVINHISPITQSIEVVIYYARCPGYSGATYIFILIINIFNRKQVFERKKRHRLMKLSKRHFSSNTHFFFPEMQCQKKRNGIVWNDRTGK